MKKKITYSILLTSPSSLCWLHLINLGVYSYLRSFIKTTTRYPVFVKENFEILDIFQLSELLKTIEKHTSFYWLFTIWSDTLYISSQGLYWEPYRYYLFEISILVILSLIWILSIGKEVLTDYTIIPIFIFILLKFV